VLLISHTSMLSRIHLRTCQTRTLLHYSI
jgi:hypothetical protein